MANMKNLNIEHENINFELNGHKHKIVTDTVRWNHKTGSLMYYLSEPELSEKERTVIFQVKELAKNKRKNIRNIGEVAELYDSLKGKLSIDTTSTEDAVVVYYIYRDVFGYGKIEGLIWDPNIKFISFDRIGAPITVFHKDYGYIPTNVIISTPYELSDLLLLLRDRSISRNEDKNILIGRTVLGSVIFLNKTTDTFAIRKTEPVFCHPLTLLMKTGLANVEMLSFIEFFLKNKSSILVIGPKISNKIDFISGLCSVLDDSKIVTFEIVPEFNLLSDKWIPEILPLHMYSDSNVIGNVLRHAPDYVVVNGVTGPALKGIVNRMSKDYSGIVSIDAKSIDEGIKVLQTSIDKSALTDFDIIVLLTAEKRNRRYLQRIKEIAEVVEYSPDEDKMILNTVFKWDIKSDTIVPLRSVLLEKLVKKTGKNPKKLIEELKHFIRSKSSLA